MVQLQSKYIMTKKMFLNRERAIPTATEAPSVSREDIVPSTSRNISASETINSYPLGFWMGLLNLFQNLIRPGVVYLSSLIL